MKQRAYFIVVFLAAAGLVISRSWITEDAYISFRSIHNLLSGYGLDYNPGERVESYSHPVWAFLLIVPGVLGFSIPLSAFLLGLVCSLVAIALLVRRSYVHGAVPIGVLAMCSVSGFLDFATSGMEFSLAFLLLTLFYLEKKTSMAERPFYFALILQLLYHTRPETALLYVYYSGFLVFDVLKTTPYQTRQWGNVLKTCFWWALPFLLVSGSIHGFRYLYYGEPFSNIYFAKAGFGAYYEQGLKYLLFFVLYAPAFLAVIVALGAAIGTERGRALVAPRELWNSIRDIGASLLLLLYVVRVGGDFMAFRLLLPSWVILCLVLDRFSLRFKIPALWPNVALSLVFLALSFWPVPLTRGFIADERRIFQTMGAGRVFESTSNTWAKRGASFRRLQACLDYSPFVIANSMTQARCLRGVGLGYVGVAAGEHVLILDEQGLTDRDTARSRVLTRFRPGHEHYNTLQQVIDKGSLFCSTGEPEYDRTMESPAGILIRLDPYLIATLPRSEERLTQLRKLKEAGSGIIPRLEQRYGNLEVISARARAFAKDPAVIRRQACWSEFEGGPETYFY